MGIFLLKIINLIFPPRPSQELLFSVTELPANELIISVEQRTVLTLASFQNPRVHAAIVETKYFNNQRAARLLAQLLTTHAAEQLTKAAVIVPIPLSSERRQQRGYNQMEEVLKQAKLPYAGNVLKRDHRESQTTMNRAQRMANMRTAFSLSKEKAVRLQGQHILLVDDVVTTGATLTAAAKVLAAAEPASITLLALAH